MGQTPPERDMDTGNRMEEERRMGTPERTAGRGHGMRRRLGGVLGRLSRRRPRVGRSARRIPVSLTRFDGRFVVRAELPGSSRRELSVTAHPDHLHIVVDPERRGSTSGRGGRRRSRRRRERIVGFPVDIDEHSVTATYREGVLTIRAIEERAARERTIPIGGGERAERPSRGGARGREEERGRSGEVRRRQTPERARREADLGPSDEEIRRYETNADRELERQRDIQRDKSGEGYRRG